MSKTPETENLIPTLLTLTCSFGKNRSTRIMSNISIDNVKVWNSNFKMSSKISFKNTLLTE